MHQDYRIWQTSYWSHTWRTMPVRDRRWFTGCILLHFMLALIFTGRQGVTFDEPDYFAYVVEWAKGNPERQYAIMDSKTPMMAPALVPALFKPLFPEPVYTKNIFFFLLAGRPFLYIYQLVGAFVTCCWMFRLAGPKKWILPWLFFIFDPLVFCYSMIIGSDTASAALLVTLLYFSWRYTKTALPRYWYGVCVMSALAVVTKASMLFCYPLLLLLFGLDALFKRRFSLPQAFKKVVLFVLVQLVVINLAYYGSGSFSRLGNINFESSLYQKWQSAFSVARQVPVPLPLPFIRGFDMLQHHAEIGGCTAASTYNGVYLFGKLSCDGPLWYYYIGAALIKVPLFIWLLVFLLVARLFAGRKFSQQLRVHYFLLVPFLYFLFLLSVVNKFQIGMRHTLILMPFLYIGLSPAILWLHYRYRKVFYGLTVLHAVSIASFFPNLLAYTNELVWDKKNAYRLIRDSSIDYGQSQPWLDDLKKKQPAIKQPTNIPDTGRFAISVSHLFAVYEGETKNIAWLRNHFNPDGAYRYTILLFDISAKDLEEKGLILGKP